MTNGENIEKVAKLTTLAMNTLLSSIFEIERSSLSYAAFLEEVFLKQIVKQRSLGAINLSIIFHQATG